METTGWFDGKPAKIRRSGGTTGIHRLLATFGGATVIDNWASSERLSDHMSGLW